ncbi:class I histocompatibility antigen, F10 alpha chain-like [Arapaima gigas]
MAKREMLNTGRKTAFQDQGLQVVMLKRRTSRDSGSSMKVPAVVLLVLGSAHLVSTDSHSLSGVVTLISGQTAFPEFTGVLLVNDVPVEYYDSDIKKIVSRRHWRRNDTIEETDLRDFVITDAYSSMKIGLQHLRKISNHTAGVHALQVFGACDLEDETLSRFFILSAYDGDEKHKHDVLSHTLTTVVPEFVWEKTSELRRLTYTNIYQPLCVRTLRRYLQEDKNILLRKGAVLCRRLFTLSVTVECSS